MSDTTRLICALVGTALFYLGLRAARLGRFDTMQGALLRVRKPRVFNVLLVFWLGAAIFCYAAAVGAFDQRP